jgi:multicomponent Na+:H+ antiporter subunit E
MMLTSQVSLPGFITGFSLSLAVILLFRPVQGRVNWRRLPGQLLALLFYLATLYRDIFLSGLDTARRALSPDMRLNPGIVQVPIQDPEKNSLIAALSADAISLTPGELVLEIEENSIMHIHSLDVTRTAAHAGAEQAKRLRILKRILGRD